MKQWLPLRLLASLVLMAGCSEDKKTPVTPTPDDPRETIEGVLAELGFAYRNQDLDRFAELFDEDDFAFIFDHRDVKEDPDIPDSWGWPQELTATRNLFESPVVERIELDYQVGAPTDAVAEDVLERPFPEGTKKVLVTEVNVSVEMRDRMFL